MPNNKINLSELKCLLARFFENGYKLNDDIVLLSAKYLFGADEYKNSERYPELQFALKYLKNVIQRNQFLTLESLIDYFKAKETKTKALFEKLEETNPEEYMAINFKNACTMYMRNLSEDHAYKSAPLYYLRNIECETRTIEVITYKASIEDEKRYMAQVLGNKLINKSDKCCTCTDKIDDLVSN